MKAVIEQLTQQQIHDTHSRMMQGTRTTEKGCQLVQLVPTKAKGYAQVSVKGVADKKVLAHVLAFWVAHGPFLAADGLDVSHLCHNPLCVNPEHLVRESKEANQRRKGCPGTIRCPCPCGHKFSACRCVGKKCL